MQDFTASNPGIVPLRQDGISSLAYLGMQHAERGGRVLLRRTSCSCACVEAMPLTSTSAKSLQTGALI